MKTLELVFTSMTSAFLAESCHDDGTQDQQTGLKTAKSTVEVHLVSYCIYVATKAGGQMGELVGYCARLRKGNSKIARDLRKGNSKIARDLRKAKSKIARDLRRGA
jgi:hypothetical protein